jgi:hypothetical protein
MLVGKIGRYGNDYSARAVVARVGLGANPPEDAIYINCYQDSTRHVLTGNERYVIHFDKTELPPVKAFWSITMYDNSGYFVANAIHRFAIGDRDPLTYNSDGSLDLYVQRESPGREHESNWLPASDGAFNLCLRMYWPKEEALTGKWIPPAMTRQ